MLPSSFQISLPLKFPGEEEHHLVEFNVLNIPSKPVLGQPWLRKRDLCIDLGFSTPGRHCVRTSKESNLPFFSTPLLVESLTEPGQDPGKDPGSVSLAKPFSRYSVPYLRAKVAGLEGSEDMLLDTGAMVNIMYTCNTL